MNVNDTVSVHHWRRYFPAYADPGPSSQTRPPQPTQPVRRPTPPIIVDDTTVDRNAPESSTPPIAPPPQPVVSSHPPPPAPPVAISDSTEPIPAPEANDMPVDAPTDPAAQVNDLPAATDPPVQSSTSGPANGKVPMRKQRLWRVDKMFVCRYAEQHPYEKHEDIAAKYGVERSTISKILKHKDKWAFQDPDRRLKDDYPKHRPGKFPDLELRLEEWTKLATRRGNPVSDNSLRKKARAFADEMGITADKFKASSGWVENFKHRVGIRRGFYVGDGTAEAAIAAITAPVLAPTFAPPPMPTIPPSVDHGLYPPDVSRIHQNLPPHASASLSLSTSQQTWPQPEEHLPDISRIPENPSPHASVSLSPLASQQTWPQPEEQSPAAGESSMMAHAPGDHISERNQDFDYQHPNRSPSAPATIDHAETSPIPPLTTSSDTETYADSTSPAASPLLDDQPIRTLKEAEYAFTRFAAWASRDHETLTIEELNRVMNIRYRLFEKAGGRI